MGSLSVCRVAVWAKVRIRSAVDAIVGGVIGRLDAPDALILGRWDDRGRLQVAGCTRPLRPAERAELADVLVAVDDG